MADSIVLKLLNKNLLDYDILTKEKEDLEKRIIIKLNSLGIKGSNYNEVVIKMSGVKDRYASIFSETEKLVNLRDETIKEIEIIENTLKSVRNSIKGSNELEYKVFVLKYIEGLTLQEIADRERYSLVRIKQISADLNKKLSVK